MLAHLSMKDNSISAALNELTAVAVEKHAAVVSHQKQQMLV